MKKIFYTIGLVAMIIGGVMMFKDENGFFASLIGLAIAGGGLGLVLLTFIASKIRDNNTQDNFDGGSDSDLSLEMKVNHAISSARQNSFKSQSEIRRLTAWCNDAIFSTFHQEYEKEGNFYEKEKLMEKFDEIKDKYASKISFETLDKCENIVKDYQLKIDGYKERLAAFEKQEKEYTVLKGKLQQAKQQMKRMAKLDSHKEKIENASDKESLSILESTGEMQQLTVGDIAKEVAEKELYYKQLEELNFKYK